MLNSYLEVGVAVGKDTPYKYIIVNIHYLPIVKNDYSGNQFLMSRKRFVHNCVFGRACTTYLSPDLEESILVVWCWLEQIRSTYHHKHIVG